MKISGYWYRHTHILTYDVTVRGAFVRLGVVWGTSVRGEGFCLGANVLPLIKLAFQRTLIAIYPIASYDCLMCAISYNTARFRDITQWTLNCSC